MRTFFTSDLHFGHENIIKYCERPFANAEEMGRAMIRLWNETVTDDDVIYVLGDFAMHQKAPFISDVLAQLKGTKHLIKGNHDDRRVMKKVEAWASINDLLDLKVDGQKVRLCHHPLTNWRGERVLLHGHMHSRHPWTGEFSRDVGVDANGFRPHTIEELLSVKEKV
jgi:calcineurin-like phosphoesterase family protein